MAIAVYPGSFDPVTLGHLDIIERSAHMMDHLIVGVLQNNSKTPLFSVEERVKMLEDVTSYLPNVEVRAFGGLLVDFVHQCQADVIVRGLRAITDFEYELQMAQTNHKLQYRKRDCRLSGRHQRVPASCCCRKSAGKACK